MSENAQYRWVWVIGSFVSFAFIIFLYYLATLMPDALNPESDNGNLAPHFTFYNDLPNRQVTQARHAPEKPPQAYPNSVYNNTNVTTPQEIILQAGSYKLWQDADQRKAELALLGLESRVNKVKLNDGTTWYRVELGPFPTTEALNHARSMLTINGVDFYQKKARG
jgi:cell division protein FtsN